MGGDERKRRMAMGRDERKRVPFERLAETPDPGERRDPVAVLVAQDATRLAELVPIRHTRMQATPFTFYRGGAAIMASDFSLGASTALRAQLCGDAHLSNFGVFKGPDRRLVFDVNDFDETLPGPFEWDLKRLVASVAIAGRHNDLSDKQIRRATRATVRAYRQAMQLASRMSPLDVHYARTDVADAVEASSEKLRKRSKKAIEKATRKDSLRALRKLTTRVDGEPRIVDDPPMIVRLDDVAAERDGLLRDMFERYRASLPPHRAAVLDRYRIVDVAHKVVGVGSVGTRCLIVLMESDFGDPLFLQFKEATASVLEPYCGASEYTECGERVVRGQRLMQSAGDVLLGWSRYHRPDGTDVDFYFRQLWDGKGSAEVEQMGPQRLANYVRQCGATLAVAHARTGDAATIAGYVGDDRTLDDALHAFATSYAELNEGDHEAHRQAIRDGRIDGDRAARPS